MSPLARTLKLNGYSTAHFASATKCRCGRRARLGRSTPGPRAAAASSTSTASSAARPNQWYPTLYEGTTPVEPKKTPEEGYHLMEDMTDKAMAWMSQQKALAADKPFFVYFAPGATHAPHHVPKEWRTSQGQVRPGWDKLREETFRPAEESSASSRRTASSPRRHKRSRVGRHARGAQAALRRQMEVYAASWSTRPPCGRLLEGLKKLGILEDTLVYYIIGDNGASGEAR